MNWWDSSKGQVVEVSRIIENLQLFTVAIHLSESSKQPSNFVQK